MNFIVALLITIGSALLYEKIQMNSLEVAVGCLAVSLVSLIVAVVIAPWQIQLLLLLGIGLSASLSNTDPI